MSGLLGKAVSSSGNDVEIYQAPVGTVFTSCDLNIVNTNVTDATLRVYITTSAVASIGDVIEYDIIVPAKGTYVRSCLLLSAGEKVVFHADSNGLIARLSGIEKT